MSHRNRKSPIIQNNLVKDSNFKTTKLSKQKFIKRNASYFSKKIIVSKLWESHQRIDHILTQLSAIESGLNVRLPNRTKETISQLENWAANNGVEMHDACITKFDEFEYGLFATNNITEGSIVVSVPRKLMITVDSIKDSPMETLYNEDAVLQQLPNVALAIFILVERFRKDKISFWSPYFEALPSEYTTCVYFAIDDLNELKGSPALEYSLKMYKNIARQYAYFWNIFQKSNDEASNILRDIFTFEQYRWAVSTVMTRQNYIPCADRIPVNVIVPVWDFCNHANNQDESNTEPSTTYSIECEKCICLAPKNFTSGEQINIFYGERSNADFLVHNGFVYPQNHHDLIKVKFGVASTDSCSLRVALLEKLKLPPSGEFMIKKTLRDPIHSSLLAFVRIFKMNEDEIREWLNRDDAHRILTGPINSMNAEFECVVLQYIQTRISILLKAYSTTLEEDEKLLQRPEFLSKIRRLIITQRITEKRILHNAVGYCEMKIAELKMQNVILSA